MKKPAKFRRASLGVEAAFLIQATALTTPSFFQAVR